MVNNLELIEELLGGGQIGLGNIDLSNRPVVRNPDGSISTLRSMSIGTGRGETLIPTIVGGKELTPDAAVDHFRRTGEHLGIFNTPEAADIYGRDLSQRMGRLHGR